MLSLPSHCWPYLIVCFNQDFCSDPNFSPAHFPSQSGGTSSCDASCLPRSADSWDGRGDCSAAEPISEISPSELEGRNAMQYVILGQHTPDLCPTSNAKMRERIQQMMTQMEAAQQKHQVRVLSGHVLGASHRMVVLAEASTVEAVRDFVMETGLVQWNSVEIYPSWALDGAIQHASALAPINW
jgi:hypothetical protein